MHADQRADCAPPESPVAAPCRVADLEVFRGGDGLSLVYARDSGAAGFYRGEIVSLLASCREFRTVDEHVRAYTAGNPGAMPEFSLRRELVRLCRAGFLVSEPSRPPAGATPPCLPPISSVGIPTCDRAAVLRRAIGGYAQNCARHGRAVDFVVADDSPGLGTRKDCQAMLKELAGALGIGISYAGLEEKSAFVSRLASAGNIPEDVLRFGCLPDRSSGVTVGANRNALLLHTVGERIISADDDTVCKVAVPPEHLDGLDLAAGGNTLQLWFFRHRAEALAAVEYVEEDLLGRHGRYLGEAPAPMLAAAGAAAFRLTDPALLRRVHAGPGRIRVTANGIVGDCGWDNPDFHLFQEGPTFARLVRSAADFDVARGTREMIQAVPRATITGLAEPKFAMCIGLDNTRILPPFPPVGRAEEVAFGAVLTACFGDAYAAHLPLLVQHDPLDGKRFSAAGLFSIGLGSWLPACVSRFDPGLPVSPAARLRSLGQFLADLGRLPGREFDEFARLAMWGSMDALIRGLEDRLAGAQPAPAYWSRDVRQFMARARRSALAPAEELYASIGGRAALQRLLDQFGNLLMWWPAIVDAARRLRGDGDRLARPVAVL